MNRQPGPENNLIRFYLRHNLVLAALLLAVLAPLYLLLREIIPLPANRTALTLLGLLSVVFGFMMFLQYRYFVWPAHQFLQHLQALRKGQAWMNASRLPEVWKPWFATLEGTIHTFKATTDEMNRQNETLLKLVRERTAELEMINSALDEEVEERSLAESALQITNRKLQEISQVDGLTGIANRRKFDEYFPRAWREMARERAPLSLILCEIDHFNRIREACGHQGSDLCLQEVAKVIRNSLHRPGDLAARYQRGRFLILLPRTDSAGAIQVAEKLQQGIAEQKNPQILLLPTPHIKFTIGLASTVPEREHTPDALLAMAQQAFEKAREGTAEGFVIHNDVS